MKYTLVDRHGNPRGSLTCPEDLVGINTPADLTAIAVAPPNDNCRWNGSFFEALSPKPTPFHLWDSVSESWMDTRPPEAVKEIALNDIKAVRTSRSFDAFAFKGHRIQADTHSRFLISTITHLVSLTGQLPQNWLGTWRTAANEDVEITSTEDWKELVTALYEHDRALYQSSLQSKQSLEENT